MPISYSIDFRKKILDAYNNREGTNQDIANRFKISISTVKRIGKRFKETGKVETYLNRSGRKMKISENIINKLLLKIKDDPNLTLKEMQKILANKLGVNVTIPTIYMSIKNKDVRYKKKSHYASQRDRDDVKKKS